MIQRAIHEAMQRGKQKITLTTLITNERGIHLYKECGFQEIGIHRNQYKIEEEFQDEILMEMWIGLK